MNTCVSESLLCKGKKSLSLSEQRRFCLGLPGWCPCIDCSPLPMASKDPSKPLSLKRKERAADQSSLEKRPSKKKNDRFTFDVTTDDLEGFMEGSCPENTAKSTEWAVRNFEAWRLARNEQFPEEVCPDDVLEDESDTCKWLCRFVSETRKADGKEYTPRSLQLLLAGLQRHLRKIHPDKEIKLFSDPRFQPLKNTCDAVFKKLHKKGIGAETKATPVLTAGNEVKLWECGTLNMDTPKGLLRAVFFYNGKNFCLRGGAEQRGLKLSQLKRETVEVSGKNVSSYVYTEFGSKNRQGGFNSLNSDNKVVRQYANTEGTVCHVQILDKYLDKIPDEAREADNFYLTPVSTKPADPSMPWYTKIPVGKNTLNKMMKEMSQEASLSTSFTNHSLRAYGTSTMYQAGVPEKIIQERTGHKSLESLRQYERTTESQLLDVSNVMSNNRKFLANPSDKGDTMGCSSSSSVAVCSTATKSVKKSVPTMLLSGCNFTNCTIAFSGNIGSENKGNSDYTELLDGISVDQFLDDSV